MPSDVFEERVVGCLRLAESGLIYAILATECLEPAHGVRSRGPRMRHLALLVSSPWEARRLPFLLRKRNLQLSKSTVPVTTHHPHRSQARYEPLLQGSLGPCVGAVHRPIQQ
jgi:hypothetical protein